MVQFFPDDINVVLNSTLIFIGMIMMFGLLLADGFFNIGLLGVFLAYIGITGNRHIALKRHISDSLLQKTQN